jgi:hypothetical protein
MPNRSDTHGMGGGEKAHPGGDRVRTRPADYGHDENYRPGYHEGGTRFGFFGLSQDPSHPPPRPRSRAVDPYAEPRDYTFRPQTDQEFDPDYLSWRDQQMQRHDRDYADWRREQLRKYDDDYWRFRSERREDFHQRFQDWRTQRGAEVTVSTGSEFGQSTGDNGDTH